MLLEQFKLLDFDQQVVYTLEKGTIFRNKGDEDYEECNNTITSLYQVDSFLVLIYYSRKGRITRVYPMNSIFDLNPSPSTFDLY